MWGKRSAGRPHTAAVDARSVPSKGTMRLADGSRNLRRVRRWTDGNPTHRQGRGCLPHLTCLRFESDSPGVRRAERRGQKYEAAAPANAAATASSCCAFDDWLLTAAPTCPFSIVPSHRVPTQPAFNILWFSGRKSRYACSVWYEIPSSRQAWRLLLLQRSSTSRAYRLPHARIVSRRSSDGSSTSL